MTNFKDLAPDFILIENIDEAYKHLKESTFVIKPLDGYGGSGILKIVSENEVHSEKGILYGKEAKEIVKNIDFPTMAMKYLKNVGKGDKRILVIDGEIVGAILRSPEDGKWLCNLSQGATASICEVTEKEIEMVNFINPIFRDQGCLLYGVDTLVDDNGERIISEVNTTNAGGFYEICELDNASYYYIEKEINKLISKY